LGSALTPNVAILSSAVLWGTLWIPLRRMDETGLSGPVVTAVGFLVPLLVLLPAAALRWRSMLTGAGTLWLAGLFLASAIALYAEGVVRGEVARVILLFYLTPVWSTLLGRLLLGQTITARRWMTILLGLAGMVVIFGVGARAPLRVGAAEWMGLAAGIVWALAMVYIHRTASRPTFDRVLVQFVFLGPVFLLLSLIPGRVVGPVAENLDLSDSAPWLAAFALIWMLPVSWLTVFGASRLDPGRVAICLMLEVVVGLTTASLLTDEPFGLRELLGAILIMGASGVEMTGGPRGTAPAPGSPESARPDLQSSRPHERPVPERGRHRRP
jgi:drug/metabolite transporter (DMT)-like permease